MTLRPFPAPLLLLATLWLFPALSAGQNVICQDIGNPWEQDYSRSVAGVGARTLVTVDAAASSGTATIDPGAVEVELDVGRDVPVVADGPKLTEGAGSGGATLVADEVSSLIPAVRT